jgi:hypothetical protein
MSWYAWSEPCLDPLVIGLGVYLVRTVQVSLLLHFTFRAYWGPVALLPGHWRVPFCVAKVRLSFESFSALETGIVPSLRVSCQS